MTVKLPIDPRRMPDGVVLTLSVRYLPMEGETPNPRTYTFIALKSGGYWYLTGANSPHMAGWTAVERWLSRDNRDLVRVEIQTGTKTIWPEPVEVAVHRDLTRPHPMDSFSAVIDRQSSPAPIIAQEEVEPENCPHHPDEPGSGGCPFDSCRNCGGYHCGWICPDGYGH